MTVTPQVEILLFEGCPNAEPARELVERVAGDLGIVPEIHVVEVATPEAADRTRFLGSPSIRVNGRDVEPGAEARTDFTLSCRVYRASSGLSGLPAEAWLRDMLRLG